MTIAAEKTYGPMQLASITPQHAQNSFQYGVEIATHLRHPLIAILAKVRRWLVVFKKSPALLVLTTRSGGGNLTGVS